MASGPDPEALRVAKLFVDRIRPDYPVIRALLYGSRARGDARPDSDLDLAVVLGGAKGRAVAVGPEMTAKGYEVALENQVFISPLPIWEEDWRDPDRHANPWLIRSVQRDGVAVDD